MHGDGQDIHDRLLRDQRKVGALAADLKAVLAARAVPDGAVLAAARWAFASALMQHLALKERHVYAKLEPDPRTSVNAFFRISRDDLRRRFDAYHRHIADWPASRALAHWPAYQHKAIAIVDLFVARLRYEETELLPFATRHDIDITFPSPVTSNWVRQAFDVKRSIEQG